jgi:hypothetical protein
MSISHIQNIEPKVPIGTPVFRLVCPKCGKTYYLRVDLVDLKYSLELGDETKAIARNTFKSDFAKGVKPLI